MHMLVTHITHSTMRVTTNNQNTNVGAQVSSTRRLIRRRRNSTPRHRLTRKARPRPVRSPTEPMISTTARREGRRRRNLRHRTNHPNTHNRNCLTKYPRQRQLPSHITRRRSRHTRASTTSSINTCKTPHVHHRAPLYNRSLPRCNVRTMGRSLKRAPRHRNIHRHPLHKHPTKIRVRRHRR